MILVGSPSCMVYECDYSSSFFFSLFVFRGVSWQLCCERVFVYGYHFRFLVHITALSFWVMGR